MRTVQRKLSLVTGSASGIGRAIACELARGGANLILVDVNRPALDEAAAEVRAIGVEVATYVADLGRPWDVERLVDSVLARWGGLDILVNCAGVAFYGLTEHMRDDQWDRLLAVNLHGPMLLSRRLLPSMLTRPEAHILNVCSLVGLVPTARLTAYQVSKAGLIGFSESLRAEYGRRGLGVTALCPGPVRTNMFRTAETSPGRKVPNLPGWMHSSPERVARRAVRAIRGGHGTIVVSWFDRLLWRLKRIAPAAFDRVQQFQRRRRHIAPATLLVDSMIGATRPSTTRQLAERHLAIADHTAA